MKSQQGSSAFKGRGKLYYYISALSPHWQGGRAF